jgi:hypothetical protein
MIYYYFGIGVLTVGLYLRICYKVSRCIQLRDVLISLLSIFIWPIFIAFFITDFFVQHSDDILFVAKDYDPDKEIDNDMY